jgi:hypothetical protein
MPREPRAWVVYWRGTTFERFELRPEVAQFSIDVERRMRALGPASAQAIADRAGFRERLETIVAELRREPADTDAAAVVRVLAADAGIVALVAARDVGHLMEEWS